VIRLMWSGERIVLVRRTPLPTPRRTPRPAARAPDRDLAGAFKPRMQRLAGRKADGWIPSLGPLSRDDLRAGNRRIDEAAEAACRAPREIRRVVNVQGVIGENRTAPPAEQLPVGYIRMGQPFAGPPEWWARTLTGFAEDGFDTIVFLAHRRLARHRWRASRARWCRYFAITGPPPSARTLEGSKRWRSRRRPPGW